MRTTALVVILSAAATAACGPSEQDRVTTQASQSIISVAVAGPANVTPGSTIAYTAIGHTAAGANTDITSRVFWTTGSGSVLMVNGVGQATGKTPGETQIVAALTSTLSGRMTVLVLPAGTFRLTGTVTDGGVPIPGAIVSVVSGTGPGSPVTTISDGTYRLYGVAGDVQLQITSPGYTTSIQPLSVTANGVADFTLTPVSGIPTLTGTYSMTISADSACAAPGSAAFTLPGDVRERRYTATISQTGPRFQITLGGAVFATSNGHGNSFSGTIIGGQIQFQMNDGYYYGPYPDLLESLGGSRYLSVWGSGTLSLAGQDLTGVINGGYGVFSSTNIWGGAQIGACYSRTGHPIVLTRQTSTSRIRR